MTRLWRMFHPDQLPAGFELADVRGDWSIPFPWRPLDDPGPLEDWPELELFVPEGTGLWDSHPCIKGFEAYSQRLRDAIESALSPVDEVQWLPVTLARGDRVEHRWVCNPLFGPEAMDAERTKRIDVSNAPFPAEPITSAVFDLAKLGDHQLLKYPYGAEPVATDRVRGVVEAAGCTGINWVKTPTVDRRRT